MKMNPKDKNCENLADLLEKAKLVKKEKNWYLEVPADPLREGGAVENGSSVSSSYP